MKTMIKRWLCFAIMFVLIFVPTGKAASPVGASWEDEKKVWEQTSGGQDYKDPGYAAKLSLGILPIDQGHFYVGNVKRGIWSSLFQTISLVVIAVPILNSQARSKGGKSPIWTLPMVLSALAGTASFLGIKVWSAFDAAEDARQYNLHRQ